MKTGPEPKDILEFQFKQSNTWQISNSFEGVPAACSLLVVDGKRGLIYVASDNKITVLKSGGHPDKHWKKEYILPGRITRLALNCDCTFLAVTLLQPTAFIYNASSLVQQNLQLLREIKLSSTDNVHVLDLRWNPCIPGMLCTVTSDCTVGSFNITADKNSAILTILEKLERLEVLCVAWSPKGKQLVVGCKNGSLLQLKPDLKVARSIAGPNPGIGSVIALLWISNYQFCATYLDSQEARINVLIIDAPKGEANANFTCYEDITYGFPGVEGEEEGPRYYFEHISEYGLIVAASSGSSEVAVLGSRDQGTTWQQWQLVDSGRAQLPLVRTTESYPVGLAVDKSTTHKLPWGGEGSTLPYPVPILHIFGTSGQLCSFHMINLMAGIPGICSPPTEDVPPCNEPRVSLAPTEISFNLMGGVTSTPRPKQTDAIPEGIKIAATTNLFADIPKAPTTLPQPQVELVIPKPQQSEQDHISSKVETTVEPSREVKQQEKIGIDNNICIRAYQEEWSLFEKELKNRREVQTKVDIGSATERSELIEKSEKMNRFLIELQDTTASLTSDITYLKALLLQTFAWLEESKSRSLSGTTNNPQSHSDNNKVNELKSLMYHSQSKLEQAMRALDYEWLEHLNKENRKMKLPKLEFVYQNMLWHSQIIAKQKILIQTQVRKWKHLTRGDTASTLDKSMANMSLSSLTSTTNATDGAIEQRCKAIAKRYSSFTCEKQNSLRNVLKGSSIKIIKVATPCPIQDRLEATLSSLATLSPPKQVQEQKTKSKSVPKSEQAVVTHPPPQTVKSPLASLDRIVANIGLLGTPPNSNSQNKTVPPTTAPVPSPIIKVPQIDGKARAATAVLTPQTPTAVSKQNKPISVPLFGTPQTSYKPLLSNVVEVSPFTSTTSRTSVPPFVAPVLMPTTVTAASAPKPFAKIDSESFNSPTGKTDAPLGLSTTGGMVAAIPTSMTAAVTVTTTPSQATQQTSFTFSSPAVTQVSNYSTMPKQSSIAAPTTPISTAASPLQSFSFSSPAISVAFSFASKPTTVPSTESQSLDLSTMGLNLQSSNIPGKNLTPATTVTSSSLFGSAGSPPSGSIFDGASITQKDKPQGTIFGSTVGSSIFGGSASSGTSASLFGGTSTSATTPPTPSIFGGNTTVQSTFGSSPTDSPKNNGNTTQAASGFQNSMNSSSSSVFGNISSTPNTASLFGGTSAQAGNTSVLEGRTTSSTIAFGTSTASTIAPAKFAGESVTPSTSSVFGRPLESNAPAFGASPTISSPLSGFGSVSTGTSSTSIFGRSAASPPSTPIFGGTLTNQTTTSVFGTVPPNSPNQSLFGGAVASPAAATNVGSPTQTQTSPGLAFGQVATFGAKPGFGSGFGSATPIFGGGFGATAFPVGAQTTAGFGGFGSSPPMGGGNMQKVFGESSGSSTFENLATQEGGLTFGNLAQKQADPPAPPAFSGGVSFQSWRN